MERILQIKLTLDALDSQKREIKVLEDLLVNEYNFIIESRKQDLEVKTKPNKKEDQ